MECVAITSTRNNVFIVVYVVGVSYVTATVIKKDECHSGSSPVDT